MLSKVYRAVSREIERIPKRMLPAKKALTYARNMDKYRARKRLAGDFQPAGEHLNILDNLQNDGFSMVTDLMPKDLLNILDQSVQEKLKNVDNLNKESRKGFWKKLTTPEDLEEGSPYVQFAMQEHILRIVSAYFNQIPYLAHIDLIVSEPTEGDAWKKSQLWHKDYNDSTTVKLWTYFSDVKTEEDGPLTFIPAGESSRVRASRFPVHKPDKLMEKYNVLDKKTQITGDKLSSFFIDTFRCYHQGSRVAEGHRRVALAATYVSFASYYRYENHVHWKSAPTELQNMVLHS